jgi:hypothetical protein
MRPQPPFVVMYKLRQLPPSTGRTVAIVFTAIVSIVFLLHFFSKIVGLLTPPSLNFPSSSSMTMIPDTGDELVQAT